MNRLDKIAYRNAIEMQDEHMELCDYKETKAFDDLWSVSRNWCLKITIKQYDAKDFFKRAKETLIQMRDNEEPYPYFAGEHAMSYIFWQFVSRYLYKKVLKRCRKEMAG